MTNETCGHVDDTDSVDPFDVMLRGLLPHGVFMPVASYERRKRLAKLALADAGYQIVPLEK